MDTITCNQCGATCQWGANYCRSCGSKLVYPTKSDKISTDAAPEATASPPPSVVEAMRLPVPPIQPERQPEKYRSSFGKGLLIGCLIPILLMLLMFVASTFLMQAILPNLMNGLFSGIPGG